jgi:hypothetical protein
MFHVGYDTFVMVLNFIKSSWEPTHVTIGIFEGHKIIGASMVNQIKFLLDSFGLFDKIITYMSKIKGLI